MDKLKIIILTFGCSLLLYSCQQQSSSTAKSSKPNIVIIYVDDLGYGDVGCYGAKGVKTPNVDSMAKQGLRFTDAHASASTCTPSRFALLTGSYAFRNDAAILPGDAPLLIRPGTPTLPAMLQKAGYTTAVIGKWHLGLGNGNPDWNGELKPGPLEVGFDYSFLVPATLDRVPTVFVENHKVVNLDPKDPIKVNYDHKIGNMPTGLEHPEELKFKGDLQHSNTIINGISRIGYMSGGKSALWKDEEIPNVLLGKVKDFLNENKDKPFFLYFSFTDIHVPRAPNAKFVGKSTMGSRGDVIAQMDWLTGETLNTLKKLGLQDNTLVIFTSDNGPVLDDGYDDHAAQLVGDHSPSGPYKGGKYSAYEGGTRMPTIVYWPGKVKPGISNALVSQVDLYASLAALVNQDLNPNEAPDSFDCLPAWLGTSEKGRQVMLEEAFTLALRDNSWKYIDPVSKPAPDWLKNKDIPTGLTHEQQLYDLKTDIHEDKNLSKTHADIMNKLKSELETIKKGGSRPGYKK
ncbi:sulfatase family protein [Pedobacter sp. BS3]|uniref:sulfatase family protein n=1 Tax=Pedobacter sp. BS3 TaxID=2567937 RepID=UPI00397B07D5